jgi:hypothetical protein
LLTFSSAGANNGFVDNNKLDSLQLRVQLKIFDLYLWILTAEKILKPKNRSSTFINHLIPF